MAKYKSDVELSNKIDNLEAQFNIINKKILDIEILNEEFPTKVKEIEKIDHINFISKIGNLSARCDHLVNKTNDTNKLLFKTQDDIYDVRIDNKINKKLLISLNILIFILIIMFLIIIFK